MRTRFLFLFLMLIEAASSGCSRKGGSDLPEGCATGDAVPPAVRADLETAAKGLYDRARTGDWKGIYETAATAARTKGPAETFIGPLTRTFQELGVPSEAETEAVALVKFGPGFPRTARVTCGDPERPLRLIVTEAPLQASLVQRAPVQNEQFFYSTLWHGEEGSWRLAALFAKPATLLGKDWRAYKEQAAAQNEAGNKRNAALLYNTAIDLVLPNAWTEPPEVKELERDQSRISVSDLPKRNAPITWHAPPDSFRVHAVSYGVVGNELCVVVRYEANAALADTVAMNRAGDVLVRYMETTFPEYPQVFRRLALEAFDPQHPEATWTRLNPLRPPP